VEAYGAVDELNSQIGVVCAIVRKGRIKEILTVVQRDLFKIGGDLATKDTGAKVPRIGQDDVLALEATVDAIHDKLQPLRRFILPGGDIVAAQIHVARSVCRRAERRAVALSREEKVNSQVVIYLNRLSSLLFDLARLANKTAKVKEEEWKHG
jgi:cob(I)alamin adenosyltransferase